MKNILLTVLAYFIVVSVLFTACSNHGYNGTFSIEPPTTETSVLDLSADSQVWEINPSHGGYAFDTQSLSCKVVADGAYQYSSFLSKTNDHKIEVYIGPTEMLVVNTLDGVTTYRLENYEDQGQTYTNPMVRVFDDLKSLEFEFNGEITLDGIPYQEYCAAETVQKQTTPKTEYTLYTIQTKWIDDEIYLFQYCVYADGATLMIGNGPEEIDPQLTKDTTWVIDIENLSICDTATDAENPIYIVATSSGEGVSPINDEKITVEVQHYTYVYVNTQTGKIEKIQYVKDQAGAMVTVLHTVEIEKPVITDEMTVMDDETLETAIALIAMLDSMF